jgi:hypothetical protein
LRRFAQRILNKNEHLPEIANQSSFASASGFDTRDLSSPLFGESFRR